MGAQDSLKVDILFILLLLSSYSASNGDCVVSRPNNNNNNNNSDLLSLLDFKQAITKDPTRVLSSWNTSIDFCRWKGVTCTPDTDHSIPQRQRRVATLQLFAQSLEGHISPSLGNLTSLVALNLSTNSLTGQLPPLCVHLRKLQVLDLSNNLLHGMIPDGIANCSELTKLDLYGNSLHGSVPKEIGLLSRLSVLELSLNNFTGTIPETFGNLSSLEILHITVNLLVGSIPSQLGRLSKIMYFLLGGNRLSGRIPIPLFNLTLLKELDLDSNALGGVLPSDMGDTLPNLNTLELGGNAIEGPIPASLGNVSGLATINIPNNNFTGYIPATFGKLDKLYSLNLEANKLQAEDSRSWEFLGALSNCSLLASLSLDANKLAGVLPNSVGNLSAGLQSLLFGINYMSGTVPLSITNLNNLTKFSLAYNDFTGKVEEWIGDMKKLQGLSLRGNRFNGPVPSSIGNLTQLSVLYLDHNKFEGVIPPSIGNLQQLSMLDLSYNNLHGSIPKEIFASGSMISCELSYNNLEGMLPLEVGNLQQLNGLYLSSNHIIGEIPQTLTRCQELETIKMDQNLFTGNIPEALGQLKSLRLLNLSHNNLLGAIPTDLGELKLLSQLDLSYNHLEGEIPRKGVFKNSSVVSLQGNQGLCGGEQDLLMPSCPVMTQRKGVKYYIIRALVPIVGFISLILPLYFVISRCRKISGRMALPVPSFYKEFPNVSYKDLLQATSNFSKSNLIGRGTYSSVYRGHLFQTNVDVAVIVFDLEVQGANISFMTECGALRGTRHRNLIPIISVCSTLDSRGNDFKAIIYDFMPNDNLETWLHPRADTTENPNVLGLTQRVNIAINIADALEYLHHDSQRPIIHCDLKPSNILLDDDMVAHLGDFGISQICAKSRSTSSSGNYSSSVNSASMKGTIGYIAPEYAGGGHISTSGDVYSFGVVLLEILTGKCPIDPMFHDELNIVKYVEHNFPNNIVHIVDANLQEEFQNIGQGNTEVYPCLLSLLKGVFCLYAITKVYNVTQAITKVCRTHMPLL